MKKIRCIILIYLVSLSLRLIACGNNLEATIEPTPTASASVAAEPTSAPTPTAIPTKTVEPTTDTRITAEPTDEVNEITPTTVPTPTAEPKVEEVKAVSLEAKVNGSHKVGETLSAADFTITAKMSDGSTRSNPAGWTANPLVLSSESTAITVAYNGLSTKITVKANPAAVQQQPAVPKPEAKHPYPESAYQPISQQAKDDFYAYAQARGYVYGTDITGEGHPYDYVELDDMVGVPSNCIMILYTDANGWCINYAKHSDPDWIEIHNYTGTMEFLYNYFFG